MQDSTHHYSLVVKTEDPEHAVNLAAAHLRDGYLPVFIGAVPTPKRHGLGTVLRVRACEDITDRLNDWYLETSPSDIPPYPVGTLLWWGGGK